MTVDQGRETIVVDLGCFPHRHEISLEPLIERFRPNVLYGFDPWPALAEGESKVDGTLVVLERKAAWIEDGELEFSFVRGLRSWDSTAMREKDSRGEWSRKGTIARVPCFDFSTWLRTLPGPPVVKMDIEGAEFPVLERMVEDGTDVLVSALLVEWHDEKMDGFEERRQTLLERIRCPVSEWDGDDPSPVSKALALLPGRRPLGAGGP